MSSRYNANDVAAWFINTANNTAVDNNVYEGITNLKLQKIVFLAQAAYLAVKGKTLFDDEIQAWQYGPVIPSLYNSYKGCGRNPIDSPAASKEVDNETASFLSDVWGIFGKYSAAQLVDYTHGHLPWRQAFNKGNGTAITNKSIKDFYKNIFSDAEEK